MSTQWTAPGTSGGNEPSPSPTSDGGPFATEPAGGRPAPQGGPRRELVQSMPLFPLRPLGVGEILGAAVRIYRLRAKSVLWGRRCRLRRRLRDHDLRDRRQHGPDDR